MATQPPDLLPIGPVSTSALQAYVIVGALVLLAALLMTLAISQASKKPAPSALITALSMLTLFAIAGGMATNSDEAWTIAAAGVGALAGSVTSLFQDKQQKQEVIEEVIEQVREADENDSG